jgi:alkylation response protein AidB-like acyl-CoA dehydrogenase
MNAAIDHETLALLRDSMARYAQDSYPFDKRRRIVGNAPGYSKEAWEEYANLGWLAVPLSADHGGFDGDARAIGALMEYVGSALALEPIFASAVVCGRLLSRFEDPRATEWLGSIAAGEAIFALAHAESADVASPASLATTYRNGRVSGAKALALHGDVADRLLVTARSERGVVVCAVGPRAKGVAMTKLRLVDERGAASFTFDDAPAEALDADRDATASIEDALDDARLAMCSETYGAVHALNAATNDYLKTRNQFGRPIGTNQALQHRMVELFILEQELRAIIAAAHRAHDGSRQARSRAVSAAAAHAATVGRIASHEGVHLHGGMGMTSELPVSHYFKRLMVTARLLGNRDEHLGRFAAASANAT